MKKAQLAVASVAIVLFKGTLTHVGLPSFVEELKAMRIALAIFWRSAFARDVYPEAWAEKQVSPDEVTYANN
jgi:hypothetical protein